MPDFIFYSIEELVERWEESKISRKNLLKHGAQGTLVFGVNWNALRKANSNTSCCINRDWLDLPATTIGQLSPFLKNKINLCQQLCTDKSNCTFNYTDELSNELREDSPDSFEAILCTEQNLLVKIGEVKQFESSSKDVPPYLNPDHKFYSEELAAAVAAWEALYVNNEAPDPSSTSKQNVEVWIKNKQVTEKKYLNIKGDINKSDTPLGRVATMIGKGGSKLFKKL